MSAQQNENEAVKTTIVGGRPPGSGRNNVVVPRGIEVLVKRAAVDPDFRKLLLLERSSAAAVIGLELDPAENAMLSAIPLGQLSQIINQTEVPPEQRRILLEQVATDMLPVPQFAEGGKRPFHITGISPKVDPPIAPFKPAPGEPTNFPPPSRGIHPDKPDTGNKPRDLTNQPLPPPPAGIRPDRR